MPIKLDELKVQGGELLFEQLSLRANTTLNATMILFLSLIFNPFFLGGLEHYIVSFYTIMIVHLFIIQAPTWVYVPLAIFFGFLWMVMVETVLFRGILHINAAREVAAVHLMRWQQPLLSNISVFLSSLHVLEVHP